MNNHNSRNMYNPFFKEVQIFLTNYGLSQPEGLIGMDDSEINRIEQLFKIKIGNAPKSFLSLFGKKINILGNSSLSLSFSKESIHHAYNKSSESDCDVHADIAKIDYLELTDYIKLEESLDRIILLEYDEVGRCFTLIRERDDNPVIYYYYGKGDLVSSNSNFVDYVRSSISQRVINLIRNDSNINDIKFFNQLSEQKWATFYFSKKEDFNFWIKYSEQRTIFQQLMHESFGEDSRILSIVEWENLLVEYLQD